MSIQKVIEEHYGNAWDVGDVLICLSDAVATNDPERARHAMMRCGDVARRLERRQKKDPAHQPAPETVVCQDWHGAVREMRTGTPNSAMVADIATRLPAHWNYHDLDLRADVYEYSGGHWHISWGTVFWWTADGWHENCAVLPADVKSGKRIGKTVAMWPPKSETVIAPTPSTPGFLDKAAETLVEKHVDSDEEIYQWGGGRWCVMDGKTFCWNARECEWNESTMLPEQLRQDGTRTN